MTLVQLQLLWVRKTSSKKWQKFPNKTFFSLVLVDVQNQKVGEIPLSSNPNHCEPARNSWKEGWGTLECRRTKHWNSWVPGVRSAGQCVSLGGSWLGHGNSLSTKIIHSRFLSAFNDSEMGSLAENLILIDEEHDKENLLPLPATPVSERPIRFPVVMTSSLWLKNWECSLNCLQKFAWKFSINISMYVSLQTIIKLFHSLKIFFQKLVRMCETKTVVVSIIIRVAASFCIYQVHTEKKVGEYSHHKKQTLCKKK